ncbi:WD40 repeat domain-containing serine/threonine protein kinase [Streptomyces palmae]|uniref:WD40 repeat domain-containing serine/threonine protein kinase n=1 Tax=Streptomyces palmae TaxID=1701085 RepID=UPI0014334664|nr:WD40 repeat domain-containing serine/threonine protein kinase [Streptomyces palmae]
MTALCPDDPERLGKYWLAARLGSGGQGVVYEAYDAQGLRVALKALHRDAEPFVRALFGREAAAARKVPSFCTARILDISVSGPSTGNEAESTGRDADETVPYIVSEYIPGPTLAARVQEQGPLEPDAVLRLATGAATALAAIHGAHVVHRDLKPGNILLGPDGPRIIDFGIARAPDMSVTAPGAIMGTFGYMAPEVFSGQRATPASDVFAWGAVMVFAASATEPFRGAHLGEVAHRTATFDPDLSAIPADIRPLVASALAKDPRLRPTAQELVLGLIGGMPRSADPRLALLEAGALRAAGSDTYTHRTPAPIPLGERAEAAFGTLDPAARLAAQEVMLRLVVPGDATDGSQDSVRTASEAELYAHRPDGERKRLRAAVAALAEEGILGITDEGGVHPSSAAVIPAWRRLRAWVDADRPGLLIHRRIGQAALDWTAHGERPDDLLHGTALRTCLDWLTTAPLQLRPNPLEVRFLAAARAEATRSTRRRRRLLSALAVLTVLALVAGVFGWFQARETRHQRAAAELRRAQAAARSTARAADSLRNSEPQTALLLSLAAWRIASTPESRAALAAAATQRQTSVIDLPQPALGEGSGVSLLGDGHRQLTYSPVGSQIWDLTHGREGAGKPIAAFDQNVAIEGGRQSIKPPIASHDGQFLIVPVKRGQRTFYQVVSTRDGKAIGAPLRGPDGFAPDQLTDKGQILFVRDDLDFRLLDSSGRLVASWSWAAEAVLSPDGRYVALCTTGEDSLLRLWDLSSSGSQHDRGIFLTETDFEEGSECSSRISFSSNGRRVAVRADDAVTVWTTDNGRETGTVGARYGGIDAAELSSSGRYVFGYTRNGDIFVYRAEGGPALFYQDGPGRSDLMGRLVLDERSKAVVYDFQQGNQVIRLDAAASLSFSGRYHQGEAVAVSPDGQLGMFSNPQWGAYRSRQDLVDMRTGDQSGQPIMQNTVAGDGPGTDEGHAFSADGKFLTFTDFEGANPDKQSVVVWDIERHRELYRIPLPPQRAVSDLAVSPAGRYVAVSHQPPGTPSADDDVIDVWDARTKKRVHHYQDRDGYGVFSPNGRFLVTTRGDVLDLESGDSRNANFTQEQTRDVAFSPDSTRLAVVKASGWVELWDGEARSRLKGMPGSTTRGSPEDSNSTRSHPMFSADGTLLATNNDDSVQIWDLTAYLALGAPLKPSGNSIYAMAFDGYTLRILGDGRVHALNLNPDSLAAAVCRKAGRDITPKEWRLYIPEAPYRRVC